MPGPAVWPTQFVVPPLKISAYLLDVDSPRGGAKARFFLACGFDAKQPEILTRALLAHPTRERFSMGRFTPFGVNLSFVGALAAPRTPWPMVRSVWFLEDGTPVARLATAYPARAG
jgi:hypothetical protein